MLRSAGGDNFLAAIPVDIGQFSDSSPAVGFASVISGELSDMLPDYVSPTV
jgi:hypothetical protein